MAEQASLFDTLSSQPLAARLRPRTFDEYAGQRHLVGPGKILRRLIESDHLSSMIFWGPPGVGKTTLAHIIATHTKASFITFSAVTSAIKDIRAIMQKAWFVIPDYDAVESGLKEARAILEDLKTGGYALSADYIEAKSLATVCVIILSEVMRERETPATP